MTIKNALRVARSRAIRDAIELVRSNGARPEPSEEIEELVRECLASYEDVRAMWKECWHIVRTGEWDEHPNQVGAMMQSALETAIAGFALAEPLFDEAERRGITLAQREECDRAKGNLSRWLQEILTNWPWMDPEATRLAMEDYWAGRTIPVKELLHELRR